MCKNLQSRERTNFECICNGCYQILFFDRIMLYLHIENYRYNHNNKTYNCHCWSTMSICPNCQEQGWWLFEFCPDKNEGNGFPITRKTENRNV